MADTNVQIRLQLDGSKAVMDGLKSIGDAAQSTNRMLTQLGGALAAAAGLGSLGQAAINTARLGGQLADLSARTGMSAQSLIVLRQAFKDAGIGADSVGKFVNLLQKNLYEAATNGGAAAEALDGMGLSAGKLIGLASEDQFQAVSAAISAIENPAQRTAAAMAIFGKSAGELLPLFADGGAIDSARESLGSLPGVLGRNVPILDKISDAFDRLPNKATQLFAGIYDQIAPTVKALLDAFEAIDFTKIGQNIGAFVNVAIKSFRDGKFAEFVGLTISAGFEQGFKFGSGITQKFVAYLGDVKLWKVVANALITSFFEVVNFIPQILNLITTPFVAAFDYIGNALKYAFQTALDAVGPKIAAFANTVAGFVNKVRPGTMAETNIYTPANPVAPNWEQSLAAAQVGQNAVSAMLEKSKQETLAILRESMGISIPGFDVGTASSDALAKMIEQEKVLRDIIECEDYIAEYNKKAPADIGKSIVPLNMKLELVKLELFYSSELSRINERRGSVEANWLMTNTAKYQEKKKLLEEELQLLLDQEIELQNLLKVASSEEAPGIQKRLQSVQTQQGGVENQMMGMGPSPTSFSEQFSSTLVELQNQFGSWAQQTAKTFADVFNSAISSISNGITGLIMGTMTWAQALAQIGNTILTTVVQSIVQMGVRWVLTQVMMATVGRSLQAAMLASMIPVALAQSAILATPATLATIASFGGAAAQAPAAIGAAQGIVLAQSLAAFREGGYTGSGNPDEVAGIVHRGEYVVPAEAVAMVGLDSLEAMFSGVPTSGATVVSAPMSAPAPIVMNMGVFDDPRRLTDWARSNDGRTVLVDILRQHAHEFRA